MAKKAVAKKAEKPAKASKAPKAEKVEKVEKASKVQGQRNDIGLDSRRQTAREAILTILKTNATLNLHALNKRLYSKYSPRDRAAAMALLVKQEAIKIEDAAPTGKRGRPAVVVRLIKSSVLSELDKRAA